MPRTARRLQARALAAAVLAALVLLGLAAAPLAAAASADPVEPASEVPVDAAAASEVLQAPVVVAGISGLGWDDVSPSRTPALWSLLVEGAGAAAVTTIHTTGHPACPVGGWLSLSAGRIVMGQRLAGACIALPPVAIEGQGARVTSWQRLLDRADPTARARIGTLGSTLSQSSCVTAVGPGAALALAAGDGTVSRYRPVPDEDMFGCPVTFVDLGETSRVESLGAGQFDADRALARLVELVPSGTDLLVTSVSAPLGAQLQMGVMVLAGSDQRAMLSTSSTRRPGVVRLLDLPSTLFTLLGLPEPPEFQGSPLVVADQLGDPASTVESLADVTVADDGLRATATPLLNVMGACALLLLLLALVIGRRAGPRSRRTLAVALLVLASVPVASYLVTLAGWWDFADPRTALWLGIGGIAVAVAAAVLVLGRQPARRVLALAAITSGVLVLDALTGTRLHWASPLGTSPVIGSRYYGFGNTTYAVFAVHTIVLAGVLAGPYAAAGRRRAATLTVVAVGLISVAVDLWPTWGADVGGGLALVPAFGLLALSVSGAPLTVTRVVASLLAGIVLVAAVAGLDWLRAPAERSHLGRFVQSVIDGGAWEVVGRKFDLAAASLERGGLLAWITLAVLLVGGLALARPARSAPPSLRAALTAWPLLRATLMAVLVSAVVGSLVNDWGIRIATVVLTAALPVVGLVCLLAADQRRSSNRAVARSPSATAPPSTASATSAAATAPSTAVTNDASAKPSPTW